jgi:methyl-accepting chemotaxis protein
MLHEIIIMLTVNSQMILLVIAGVVALALLLQAIALLAIFFGMRKAVKAAQKEIEDFRAAAMPVVKEGRELFGRVAPKIQEASVDLAAVVHTLRVESTELQSAANQFVERASRQASRLDSIATSILDAADRTGEFMSQVVHKPMRQVSGILASIKAIVETLRTPEPVAHAHTSHAPGDPETFV